MHFVISTHQNKSYFKSDFNKEKHIRLCWENAKQHAVEEKKMLAMI